MGDLPVDDEVFVGGLLVTDRTHPGGLLLIHLDVESGVKALQVGACQRPAWDHEPHLPQLHTHVVRALGRHKPQGWRVYGMHKYHKHANPHGKGA